MWRPDPGVAVAATVIVAGAAMIEFDGEVIETDTAQLESAMSSAHRADAKRLNPAFPLSVK